MRFTIDEYSTRFKMSKEMIHSRLRTKKLNYIIEEGVTYIIVPRSSLDEPKRRELHEEKQREQKVQKENESKATAPAPAKPKTTVGTIIALYQKENQHLKQRIKELETKIDRLIDDKEQMLRDERDRIEQVYNRKDEQLKSILDLVNTKLMLSHDNGTVHDVDYDSEHADEPIDASWQQSDFIELRRYLKKLELKPSERKIIKKRFAQAYGSDIRVIQQNGEFYLDFSRYDYSDLLAH